MISVAIYPRSIGANKNRLMLVMEAFKRTNHDSGDHGRGQEQPAGVKVLLDNRWYDRRRGRSLGWVAQIGSIDPEALGSGRTYFLAVAALAIVAGSDLLPAALPAASPASLSSRVWN